MLLLGSRVFRKFDVRYSLFPILLTQAKTVQTSVQELKKGENERLKEEKKKLVDKSTVEDRRLNDRIIVGSKTSTQNLPDHFAIHSI